MSDYQTRRAISLKTLHMARVKGLYKPETMCATSNCKNPLYTAVLECQCEFLFSYCNECTDKYIAQGLFTKSAPCNICNKRVKMISHK